MPGAARERKERTVGTLGSEQESTLQSDAISCARDDGDATVKTESGSHSLRWEGGESRSCEHDKVLWSVLSSW